MKNVYSILVDIDGLILFKGDVEAENEYQAVEIARPQLRPTTMRNKPRWRINGRVAKVFHPPYKPVLPDWYLEFKNSKLDNQNSTH